MQKPQWLPMALPDFRRRIAVRRSRAQSIVEFALAVPILVLVFAGIIDLGRSYYSEVGSVEASKDAVRLLAAFTSGTQGPSAANVCTRVAADMKTTVGSCVTANHAPPYSGGLDYTVPGPNQATVVVWCGAGVTTCGVTGSNGRHQTVAVLVVYGFQPLTPLIASFAPGGVIQLPNTTQMVSNW